MQVRRRARCGCGRSGHVFGSGWLVGLLLFPFTFIDSGHYMYAQIYIYLRGIRSKLRLVQWRQGAKTFSPL